MKLYIAVLDDFPDYMTPTLVAHSMLAAHLKFQTNEYYMKWLTESFKKVVVRVGKKEFEKIKTLPNCYVGYESNTLDGIDSCAIPLPYRSKEELPNVLKFAKTWKPKAEDY
jgi:hypothetical protein